MHVRGSGCHPPGGWIYPAAEQVGYALGELASGSGTIGVFVNPQ